MEKASKAFRFVLAATAMVLILACAAFTTGCTSAQSTQKLPVTAGQVQAGQPNILQIQFFPAQSLNARPVHSQASGDGGLEGVPSGLGKNWADTVNWDNVTITANVTVSSTGAATGQEAVQKGGVISGAVTQTPTTKVNPTLSAAVGPNASSSATGGEGTTGDASSETGVPAPAPAPAPAPEPTPDPADPSGDAGDADDERNVMSLRQREQIMLAWLKASQRR